MKLEALFEISLRIVGIIVVILALPQLFITIANIITYAQPEYMTRIPLAFNIASLMAPLVMIAAGLYLLTGAHHLLNLFDYTPSDTNVDYPSIFHLALKIIGVVAVVQALPSLAETLSEFLVIAYISPRLDFAGQWEMIYLKLGRSLVYLLIGLYLIKGGKYIEKIAFSSKEPKVNSQ